MIQSAVICAQLYYVLRLLLGYLFFLSSLHNIIFNGVSKRKRKKYSQIRGIMEQHFVAWDANAKKKDVYPNEILQQS